MTSRTHTIIFDTWGVTQIGWLICENGKYRYESIKKDSIIKDAKETVHLGKFGGTIGKKEKVNPRKETFKKQQEELKKENEEKEAKNPRNQVYPVFRYKNYSRRSGVYAYAISPDKTIIYVYFLGKNRGWYKYDIYSAPSYVIKNMVKRAISGWGLNRYINAHPQTYYWKGHY